MVMDTREYGGEGQALKPVLASIPNALKYMGDLSRAKFYSDILPLLQTVHIGTRHFVVVESMDALISSLVSNDNHPKNSHRGTFEATATKLRSPPTVHNPARGR
jgi:hypothetical protein